jgi:hypothetical protein
VRVEMMWIWRGVRALAVAVAVAIAAPGAAAADHRSEVLGTWYRMILELVRHTPTYSPPVASRAFAWTALVAYEATASGDGPLGTLSGQVAALPPPPPREKGVPYAEDAVLNAALGRAVDVYFANTGPTGQRAKAALARQLDAVVADGVDAATLARSQAYGVALAEAIIAASADDGGAAVENMGFPLSWAPGTGPAAWVPTSAVRMQQYPLLPQWSANRPFVLPNGAACPLPPPPAYSEDPGSPFFAEALRGPRGLPHAHRGAEAHRAVLVGRPDAVAYAARPLGRHRLPDRRTRRAAGGAAGGRARPVGIAVSDGFIVCWRDKFAYDLLRPVTYIRRHIDPAWEPLLITPPFPEYPSGHSTQSGAAAQVLTHVFGEPFAFTDTTHVDDGLPPRDFPDFWTAAREAGISRLYGGIHFRAAIELGLDQGACVGDHVNRLVTWK